MNKFLDWFSRHRKRIGYALGGYNIGAGLATYIVDPGSISLVMLFTGMVIIFDTITFK
jgi:hypothetical protein